MQHPKPQEDNFESLALQTNCECFSLILFTPGAVQSIQSPVKSGHNDHPPLSLGGVWSMSILENSRHFSGHAMRRTARAAMVLREVPPDFQQGHSLGMVLLVNESMMVWFLVVSLLMNWSTSTCPHQHAPSLLAPGGFCNPRKVLAANV